MDFLLKLYQLILKSIPDDLVRKNVLLNVFILREMSS